jgi:hypothetical protein
MSETPPDIHSMTPQQATEFLAQKDAAFRASTAPPDARARLDALAADPNFLKKLEAGDVATKQEFKALTERVANAEPGDRLDAALRGEVNPGLIETTSVDNPLTTRKLASAVEGLREAGISDDAIRQAINGGKDHPDVLRAVQELKARLFGDQTWVKRYLDGGALERKQATLIAIALNSGVAE